MQPKINKINIFLKRLNIELLNDPAIPLLGIYLGEKKHNWKRSMLSKIHCSTTHNSQDIETKCPSTVDWIKKMWHISTVEYYSSIKKNETMPFAATWMDPEIIILSEVSQTENDDYHVILLICFKLLFKQELWLGPRAWLSWALLPHEAWPLLQSPPQLLQREFW